MTEWAGDARYAALVERHGSSLLHLAILLTGNVHDAEDVLQDVLIAVAAKWPMPRSTAYLRRAVSNRAIDVIRKRHDIPTETLPESGALDSGFFHAESDDQFFRLVRALPDRQREVMVLRYHADLADRDIAQVLGISQETVRSQAHRGLAKLRLQLASEVDA